MSDYFQPDFYHFNEDSLRLVKWVLARTTSAGHILDLGAGSGIIGIELARVLKPEFLEMVELQSDFIPFIRQNSELFLGPEIQVKISESSFKGWFPTRKFDLIVSNPPYFLPGHGEQSHDGRKGLARTFLQDSWGILLDTIERSLSDEGKSFLVIRKDSRIVNEIEKASRSLKIQFKEEAHLLIVELARLHKN